MRSIKLFSHPFDEEINDGGKSQPGKLNVPRKLFILLNKSVKCNQVAIYYCTYYTTN